MNLSDLIKAVQDARAAEGDAAPDPVGSAADALRQAEETPDLAQLESEAVSQFRELHAEGEFDPGSAPQLEALADVADAVRTVAAEHAQQREELNQHVSELASRIDPPEQPDEPAEGDGEQSGEGEGDEQPAQDAESEGEPEFPNADEQPAEGDDQGGSAPADDKPYVDARAPQNAQPVPASASGTRASAQPPQRRGPMPTVRQIQSQRSKVTAAAAQNKGKQTQRYRITAAADVPRVPSGSTLTDESLADAMINRFQAMPVGQRGVGVMRNGIALIHRESPESHTLDGMDVMADAQKIEDVSNERNLPGGSLANTIQRNITAATSGPNGLFTYGDVYCIPAETDYTLCEAWATREGRLDLPTTTITNAGVRYPVWPQFPDTSGWHGTNFNYPSAPAGGWTEANSTDLAKSDYFSGTGTGTVKKENCLEMPCPEWVEQRMNLDYFCATGDILKNRMWPALVQRWLSDAMTAQAHFMDALYIQDIVARSTNLEPYKVNTPEHGLKPGAWSTYANGSLASGLLDHLLLVVAWFRNRYKMSRTTTLDGFAPDWFRDMIKLDLEKKSNRPYGTVTNAEVDGILADAGARVQWLYNYQPLGDFETEPPPPTETKDVAHTIRPPKGWPTSVDLTLFPAGSWVLGQQDIITLDALYDSTQLKSNRMTQLFYEEGWMLMNKCSRSFNVKLTDICVNGAVGPRREICTATALGDSADSESEQPQQEAASSTSSRSKK